MTPHPSTARTLPERAAAVATAVAAVMSRIVFAVLGSRAALSAVTVSRPEGAR